MRKRKAFPKALSLRFHSNKLSWTQKKTPSRIGRSLRNSGLSIPAGVNSCIMGKVPGWCINTPKIAFFKQKFKNLFKKRNRGNWVKKGYLKMRNLIVVKKLHRDKLQPFMGFARGRRKRTENCFRAVSSWRKNPVSSESCTPFFSKLFDNHYIEPNWLIYQKTRVTEEGRNTSNLAVSISPFLCRATLKIYQVFMIIYHKSCFWWFQSPIYRSFRNPVRHSIETNQKEIRLIWEFTMSRKWCKKLLILESRAIILLMAN